MLYVFITVFLQLVWYRTLLYVGNCCYMPWIKAAVLNVSWNLQHKSFDEKIRACLAPKHFSIQTLKQLLSKMQTSAKVAD